MDVIPLAYTLTGIGVYLQQLIQAIHRSEDGIHLGFASTCEIPSKWLMRALLSRNLAADELKKLEIRLKLGFAPFGPLREFCSTTLDCLDFDLYHITSTDVQWNRFTKPTVVSVYDLADLRRDGSSQKYGSLIPAIKNAERCICISEATRRDVVELLGIPLERTAVTMLAARPLFKPPAAEVQRLECRQVSNRGVPYFLAVSTVEPRKNYVRMLQAFAQVRARGHQVDFLIAGAKRSAWPEVARTIEGSGLQDSVRMLGWVDNNQLLKLMWGCEALAYASLYEGFGLPIVEAMATGTPVVASNVGSIPEVVGDSFPLVDPESVECIADRMERILLEASANATDRKMLIDRANDFSWDSTARKTIEVYRSVINR